MGCDVQPTYGFPVTALADADRPLLALWQRHRRYRGRLVAAVVMSTINKVADVVPEPAHRRSHRRRRAGRRLVRRHAPRDRLALRASLGWLAAFNVLVWVIESGSQYVADVLWRGLAQGIEHDLRVEAYDHAQHLDMSWHEGRASGTTLATLNDDVNQARALPRRRGGRDPADGAQRRARRRGLRCLQPPGSSSSPSCPSR